MAIARAMNSAIRRLAARKGRAQPGLQLLRTLTIPAGTASIAVAATWPARNVPITLETQIAITGGAASGIVFEFGNNTIGTKLAISGGSLFVAAGAAAGNAGTDGEIALPALSAVGARLLLSLSLNPGRGLAVLYVDGAPVWRALSIEPWASWSADNAGAVGAAQAGGASTQRGQAINGAPSQFALVAPLSVYQNQAVRG